MNFTSIKHTDKETAIDWTEQKEGTTQTSGLVSLEAPDVALPVALKAFVPLVAQACELPEGWEQGIAVTGVSLNTEPSKNGKPQRRGIKVHFRFTPSAFRAPMMVSTPHLRERFSDETDGAGFIPDTWKEPIAALEEAAVKFIQGARSQQEMPLFAGAEK